MEENKKNIEQEEIEDISIDWMSILKRILKSWKFIFLVTFIFSILGVGYSLVMKRSYLVSVTLAPERQNRSTGSLST